MKRDLDKEGACGSISRRAVSETLLSTRSGPEGSSHLGVFSAIELLRGAEHSEDENGGLPRISLSACLRLKKSL